MAYHKTIKHSMDLANHWTDQLDGILDWDDKNKSFRVMRYTLQALRDVLSVDEAAQLSAQLPLLIRGLFFEGWDPSGSRYERHDREGFLERITYAMMPDEVADMEAAVTGVFTLLNAHVSAGEIDDVRSNLRKNLREIWPEVK